MNVKVTFTMDRLADLSGQDSFCEGFWGRFLPYVLQDLLCAFISVGIGHVCLFHQTQYSSGSLTMNADVQDFYFIKEALQHMYQTLRR